MKVLLVEDDARSPPRSSAGCRPRASPSRSPPTGRGLLAGHEGTYDLIVLDIMLPGRNGFQVCADLREAGDWTPILDAHRQGRRARRGRGARHRRRRLPHQAVLVPRAVARVRALLRRVGGAMPSPSRSATCASTRARRGPGAARPRSVLTAREFDVLEFLVRRAGQVLSKDEILAGVWDYDFDGDPNIVEVYIGRLRRKVDEPFGAQLDRDRPRRRLPAGGDVTGSGSVDRPLPRHGAGDRRRRSSCSSSPGSVSWRNQRRVLTETLDESHGAARRRARRRRSPAASCRR